MTKLKSLLSLMQSMTKAEKKQFSMTISEEGDSSADYLLVYKILEQKKESTSAEIKQAFLLKKPQGSFDIAVNYLYDKLLEILLSLRKNKDSYFDLFQNILKAKMLFERSLFMESLELLKDVIGKAKRYENYYALLLASRLELNYLLHLNYLNTSEQDLYHKQYAIGDLLNLLRKINVQSSLYELLKHRLIYKGNIRSSKQKQEMNDLVVSELSIVASSNDSNFEITKMHQLFQANYLIGAGDYKAAFQSFKELTLLFESNDYLWANSPFEYLSTLEGVLESLRSIGNYEGMDYFISHLENLANYSSLDFRINALCLLFQYELFPMLDRGNFDGCNELIQKYKESLYDKFSWLSPIRQTELCLYTALVYFGNHQYKQAKKFINTITFNRNLGNLPLSRTIQLVKLMIYYEEGSFDIIRYETRSIKRKISLNNEKGFKIEQRMFWLLNKNPLPILQRTRDELWEKIRPNIEVLRSDKYESQILRLFDFTAWIQATILRKKLSEVLNEKFNAFSTNHSEEQK